MNVFYALLSGSIFGAGLAVSQMINPAKVLAFLDVAGDWDPSLLLVMAAALAVSAVAVRWKRSSFRSTGETPSWEPAAVGVDTRLLAGAVLFGSGWGLAGFCPGPAIASLAAGSGQVVLFVLSMIAGMGLFKLVPSTSDSLSNEDTNRKPS